MRLIGITGKARSGKDTAAKFLMKEFGLIKYSFADPMKVGVKTMFGLTDEHVHGDLKETVIPHLGVSPRRILQTLGTEWGREMIRSDLWVVLAQQKWEAIKAATDDTFHGGMIVPDVRFEDEADFIRRNGGTVIHIVRPYAREVEAHISESGIRVHGDDPVMNNTGTIEDLEVILWDVVMRWNREVA